MTLLASWIGRDRALVAVDTRLTALDSTSAVGRLAARANVPGTLVEASKLLALPHARLVLAHAGALSFLASAFLRCQQLIGPGGFDELDECMPDVLGCAFGQVLDMRRDLYPDVPIEEVRGQRLAVVGWSQKGQRMRGALFNQDPRADGFQRLPLAGFAEEEDPRGRRFAAPWNAEKSGALPYADTPEAMERLARLQMRDSPSAAEGKSGGRLLVAELTRDSVCVTSQCDLDSPRVGSESTVSA